MFEGSLLVIVMTINGSKKSNRVLKCDVINMKFLKSWDLYV